MLDDARRNADIEARARRMGIEPWVLEMSEAVPTELIREIVADNRKPPTLPIVPAESPKPGSGWVEPRVEDRSREIEMVDRMVEHMVGGPNDTSKLK
jgi:hypothetical protein